METDILFSVVLRSLGYDLYTTAGRIANAIDSQGRDGSEDGFHGWDHMVLIVTIPGHPHKFITDLGYANFGCLAPLPLTVTPPGAEVPSAPGVHGRLARRSIANNTQQDQLYWIFETKNATDGRGWQPAYAFTELEFIEQDFVNFSLRTHRDPNSWFTQRMVLTRILLRGEGKVSGYDLNSGNGGGEQRMVVRGVWEQ